MAQDGEECAVLDFTGQGVRRIELVPNAWPTTLIYDKNNLTKIENLDAYRDLQQLSIAENQLTRMVGVNLLTNLTVLSLPNNSIGCIEGLKNLTKLTWLSLSGNNVKVIEGLVSLSCLQHLDLSDNSISHLSDISCLSNLRSLLLHGNIISSLRSASTQLPNSLNILSLAENEISDLNEVCHLANLQSLEQLSVMNNPCVVMTGATPGFDYRPFVVNWCLNLRILDGYVVSEKENLKAEWLYSQGKGRHFRAGQHFQLSQYLASVCPLTGAQDLESLEEQRLSRILQHQRRLQQELGEGDRSTLKSDNAEDISGSHEVRRSCQTSDSPSAPSRSANSEEDTESSVSLKMEGIPGNVLRVNSPLKAWVQDQAHVSEISRPLTAPGHRKEGHEQDVELLDINSEDESRSTASQLSCETRYLPLHSDSSSPAHSFQMLVNNPGNARPLTAPPGGKPHGQVTSFAEIFKNAEREQRPATALDGGRHGGRNRIAANFGQAPKSSSILPTPSDTRPQPHQHKSPVSPLLKAKDFQDTDSESISTDASSASLEIKVLKALLNNHKAQKSKAKKGHHGSSHRSDMNSNANNDGNKLYAADKYQDMLNEKENCSNTNGSVEDFARSLAATKLQALWRGFKARHKDPEVVKIRTEIRAKRADEHIRQLMGEVSRQRDLYEQEKQMRLLQLEAVKHLWKEVQELQQWKQEVLASHDYVLQSHDSRSTNANQQQSTQELIDNMQESSTTFNPNAAVGASVAIHPGSKLAIPSPAPSKSVDMASAQSHSNSQNRQIKQLQQQVSQLQEVMQSVYQGNVIGSAGKDPYAVAASMVSESIRISTDFEDNQEKDNSVVASHENELERIRPPPGIPTAPEHVRFQVHDKNCVVLRWSKSLIFDAIGQPASQPLIGYRLYINERAKALVGGTKTSALIEGLHENMAYRVYIRAVSALGESENSNTVKICLGKDTGNISAEKSSQHNDPDGSSGAGGSSRNSKSPEKDQQGERESPSGKKESKPNAPSPSPDPQQDHHSLTVPSKVVNEGSSLITGDSGYLSSPCNTANTSGRQSESPSKDLAKAHAAMMPQEAKTKKTTVSEMLEKRLHSSKADNSKLGTEENQMFGEKVHSSPRMKEGLFKKLDQQPVKKGVMREELMAAKIKKRNTESPMRAIASDETTAELQESDLTDTSKTRTILTRQRRRSNSGSDKDETGSFSRENPAYHSTARRRGSPSHIPRPASKTSTTKEVLVYNPDFDDPEGGMTSNTETDEVNTSSCGVTTPKSLSRESSRPGSRAASRSGSIETLATEVRETHKKPSPQVDSGYKIDNQNLELFSDKVSSQNDESESGLERYVRGRASARETRSAPKVHVDEKRSSSVGASAKKVHEKPPLAKPATPGKDRRSISREEIKASRRRTKSEQSQSSEDEEGKTGRLRHNSGTLSSGSEREGSESLRSAVGKVQEAKESPPKGSILAHKRSSSDVVFKPLPNRPISPASPANKVASANSPQQALNSPRFRRSSSFSKSVTGEGKDAESILRQCISLELLKAAKQQDVRATAERAIAAADGGPSAETSPSQPNFNLARSRINASVIVRQSIERLNRKDPKYKSDSPLIRGRSNSLSTSAKKVKSKSPQPDKPSKQTSLTAPAALSSPTKQPKDTEPSDTTFESKPSTSISSSGPSSGPSSVVDKDVKIDPIQSDSIPQITSKSSDSSNSSSPESSVEKSSKRNKFGNKAHDLFQKLHMKLSANKP